MALYIENHKKLGNIFVKSDNTHHGEFRYKKSTHTTLQYMYIDDEHEKRNLQEMSENG